jgi:quinol monooxygenase YgiN
MIKRIVKMSFAPEKVEEFKMIFQENWGLIKSFKGCAHVELLQDTGTSNIFFTYSLWETAEDLDAYRNSELFKKVWGATKLLFNERPQAWSLSQVLI